VEGGRTAGGSSSRGSVYVCVSREAVKGWLVRGKWKKKKGSKVGAKKTKRTKEWKYDRERGKEGG